MSNILRGKKEGSTKISNISREKNLQLQICGQVSIAHFGAWWVCSRLEKQPQIDPLRYTEAFVHSKHIFSLFFYSSNKNNANAQARVFFPKRPENDICSLQTFVFLCDKKPIETKLALGDTEKKADNSSPMVVCTFNPAEYFLSYSKLLTQHISNFKNLDQTMLGCPRFF